MDESPNNIEKAGETGGNSSLEPFIKSMACRFMSEVSLSCDEYSYKMKDIFSKYLFDFVQHIRRNPNILNSSAPPAQPND